MALPHPNFNVPASSRPLAPEVEVLQSAAADVIENGDPQDNIPQTSVWPFVAGVETTVLGVGFALAAKTSETNSFLNGPAAVLGGYVVAKSLITAKQWHTRRHFEKRTDTQIEAREAIDDAYIDLYRIGNDTDGYKTAMRWYGADSAETDSENNSYEACKRLIPIIDKAEAAGIVDIVVPTNWIGGTEGIVNDLNAGTFGTVMTETHFQQSLEKHQKIQDTKTDKVTELLWAQPHQLRALIQEVRKSPVDDIRHYLSGVIADNDPHSGIPRLFQEWAGHSDDFAHAKILRARLRTELESAIDDRRDPEIIVDRDEDYIRNRVRPAQHVSLHGTNVSVRTNYTDHAGLNRSDTDVTNKNLTTYLGFEDTDDLVTNVLVEEDPAETAFRAKAGLLLLLDIDPDLTEEAAKNIRAYIPDQEVVELPFAGPTVFMRLWDERPWRNKHGTSNSLQIIQTPTNVKMPWKDKLKAAGLAAALLSPLAAGVYVSRVDNELRSEFRDESGLSASTNPALYEQFLESQSWLDEASGTIRVAAVDTQLAVEKAFYVKEGVDAIKDLLGSSRYAKDTKSTSDTLIGDVFEPGYAGEPSVYTIAPFNGADTSGYWGSDVNDTVKVSGESIDPFENGSISFSKSFENEEAWVVPLSPSAGSSKMIAYQVSVAYNSYQSDIAMPLKNGFVPAAANLSYQDDNGDTQFAEPTIKYQPQKGTYRTEIPKEVRDKEVSGVFTYYLMPADNTLRAAQPLQFPDGVDVPEVIKNGRESLGLPAERYNSDVVMALRAKDYSYTPFAESGATIDVGLTKDPTAEQKTTALSRAAKKMGELSSANCNVAASELLLATGGVLLSPTPGSTESIGGTLEYLNMASGYNNNSDNKLERSEAHAWTVTADGKIVDATPSIRKAKSKEGTDSDNSTALLAGGIALAAGAAFAFGKRRKIAEAVRNQQLKRLAKSKHAQRAVTMLQHYEYTPNEISHTDFSAEAWVEASESLPLAERLTGLPKMGGDEASAIVTASGASKRVRRAAELIGNYRQQLIDSAIKAR